MSAFREQIRAYIDRNMSPAARSRLLAATARAAVAEVIAEGRAPASFDRFVDGKFDAPEESVRGDGGGVVLYRFKYIGDAVAYAVAFLRARSPAPVAANHPPYRDSFFVSIDGRMFDWRAVDPERIPANAEVFIGNTQPYNRLVDVQMAGNRRERYSVPAGIYDDAARAVNRQFRGVVKASRLYNVQFAGQWVVRGRGRRGAGGRVQSPALSIQMVR